MLTLTAQSMLAYCLFNYSPYFRITERSAGHWNEIWSRVPLSEYKDLYVRLVNGINVIYSPATDMTYSIFDQKVLDILS